MATEEKANPIEQCSSSLLSRNIPGQPEAVARWLLDSGNRLPNANDVKQDASDAIKAWSDTDPQAAANFTASLVSDTDDSFSLPRVLTDICTKWSDKDPAGALAWVKTLPDADPHKVYALEGIYSTFHEIYPEEEKAFVEQLVNVNKAAPELASIVAGALTRGSPQAAARWALSLPGVPERREALKGVANAWVNSAENLAEAARWAASMPPDDARATTWGTVAINWTALDCLTKGLAGGSPEFFEQMKISGSAAEAWLRSLPAGADRDEAITIRNQWDESIRNIRIWR